MPGLIDVTTRIAWQMFAAAALVLGASAACGQEIVTLPTRAGVPKSFLLMAPKQEKPAGAAVLFPGGNGAIRLRSEQSEIKFNGGNFLVRARLSFVDSG